MYVQYFIATKTFVRNNYCKNMYVSSDTLLTNEQLIEYTFALQLIAENLG